MTYDIKYEYYIKHSHTDDGRACILVSDTMHDGFEHVTFTITSTEDIDK